MRVVCVCFVCLCGLRVLCRCSVACALCVLCVCERVVCLCELFNGLVCVWFVRTCACDLYVVVRLGVLLYCRVFVCACVR